MGYTSGNHHPVVHVASAVSAALLIFCILVYGTCYQAIHSSDTLKHSLPNLCTCIVWLLLLFTAGMHQTHHQDTCRSVGLTSHFFSMSSILWILISVHVVYKKSATFKKSCGGGGGNSQNTAVHERINHEKLKKSVTRLYLFAYGVSIIIVAISAAVNVKNYDNPSYCFLSFTPFVWTTLIPVTLCTMVVFGLVFTTLCILCTKNSSPSHIREQHQTFDMDMIGPHSRLNPNTGSILSLSTLHLPDAEKTTKSLIAAYISLLLLFTSTWTFGALSVVQPFYEAQEYQQVLHKNCKVIHSTKIYARMF